MNKHKQYNFEILEVLAFIFKWKKQLLVICALAAVLSYLASGPVFIKPKYRSAATFYPGTVNSVSAALFFKMREKARDPLTFGEIEETEQFMQLLESADLKNRIIQKYNLIEHYHISADNPRKNFLVDVMYNKNVKITRTDYNSIEVSVLDEDPQMSADLANAVMMMADTIKTEIKRRLARQAHEIIAGEFYRKMAFVDSLKNVMKDIGLKGVYTLPEQAMRLSEVSRGAATTKTFEELSSEYTFVHQMLHYEVENLTDIRQRFEQSKIDVSGELSNIFVIGYAYKPDQKATPIRSMIVLLSVFSAFILGCISIVMMEKYKNYKQHQ